MGDNFDKLREAVETESLGRLCVNDIAHAVRCHDHVIDVLHDIVASAGMPPGHVSYLSKTDIVTKAIYAIAKAGAA